MRTGGTHEDDDEDVGKKYEENRHKKESTTREKYGLRKQGAGELVRLKNNKADM